MAWITNDTNTGVVIHDEFNLTLDGGVDVCRTSVPAAAMRIDDIFAVEADSPVTITAVPVEAQNCDYFTRLVMYVPYDD
jgi:hypothetical protein